MVVIIASLALLPPIEAQRHVGDNFTLTTTVMDSCHQYNGTTFRIVYCADDYAEQMHAGSTFTHRNFFYWITNPYPEICVPYDVVYNN